MRQRAKDNMSAKGYIEIDVKEWTELKTAVGILTSDMTQLKDNHLPHIYGELKTIREKMSSSRPSWSVAAIIVVLSSLCVGLIVHAIF